MGHLASEKTVKPRWISEKTLHGSGVPQPTEWAIAPSLVFTIFHLLASRHNSASGELLAHRPGVGCFFLRGYDHISAANSGTVPDPPPLLFGSFTDADPDAGQASERVLSRHAHETFS